MRIIPPLQAGLWLAAQQAAARLGRPRRGSVPGRVAGGAVVAGAGAFGLAALARFLRRGTTWHPWAEHTASTLVADGPNAVSRNPMYLALAAGLVGTGLASGRPWTAVAALGFGASVTPQIRREERALAEVFGADYARYRARVRRWL